MKIWRKEGGGGQVREEDDDGWVQRMSARLQPPSAGQRGVAHPEKEAGKGLTSSGASQPRDTRAWGGDGVDGQRRSLRLWLRLWLWL